MTNFADYARHYDALYADKDYAAETQYVTGIIRRLAPEAKGLLDIGCGTGRHAMLFSEAGFDVTGVDRSTDMLEEARRLAKEGSSTIDFVEADIRDFDLGQKFDVVVAMFHVMSYLTINADVMSALRSVRRHVSPDGLFIFDFWYGPGVLTDRPAQRLKSVRSGDVEVMRFAKPQLLVNDNVVSIDYALMLLDEPNGRYDRINEQHRMRYYFRPEIELMLESTGFRSVGFTRWMADEAPDDTTWNAVISARAI